MPLIISLFTFLITSCTHNIFSPRESEWKLLDEASGASCDLWPTHPSDLQTDDIRIVPGLQTHGFYSKVTTRKALTRFYTNSLPEDYSLDTDMLEPVSLPIGSGWIGGAHSLWGSMAVSENHDETQDDSATILIHSLINRGPARQVLLPGSVDQVWLSEAKGGLWMTTQIGDTFHLAMVRVDPVKSGPAKVSKIPGLFKERPVPLGDPGTQSAGVLFAETSHPPAPVKKEPSTQDTSNEEDLSEADPDSVTDQEVPADHESETEDPEASPVIFKWQSITSSGQPGPPQILSLPLNNGVEGWTALKNNQDFALAYIAGDSLIGDSKLVIAWFQLSGGKPVKKWVKIFDLENIHVGEPFWSGNGNQTYLHILQWMDAEATVAGFAVNSAGVKPQKPQGIFPTGSTLMDTFMDRKSRVPYALIRFKEDLQWQFELCELKK